MTAPLRIQRRRSKGWTLPANTVCVTRPGPLGNPFVAGVDGTAAYCVDLYIHLMRGLLCLSCVATVDAQIAARKYVIEHKAELVGRNLACWCRLCPEHKAGKPIGLKCEACAPCHSDVLGVIGNE